MLDVTFLFPFSLNNEFMYSNHSRSHFFCFSLSSVLEGLSLSLYSLLVVAGRCLPGVYLSTDIVPFWLEQENFLLFFSLLSMLSMLCVRQLALYSR